MLQRLLVFKAQSPAGETIDRCLDQADGKDTNGWTIELANSWADLYGMKTDSESRPLGECFRRVISFRRSVFRPFCSLCFLCGMKWTILPCHWLPTTTLCLCIQANMQYNQLLLAWGTLNWWTKIKDHSIKLFISGILSKLWKTKYTKLYISNNSELYSSLPYKSTLHLAREVYGDPLNVLYLLYYPLKT